MSIVAIILILAVVVAVAVRFLVKMESEALRKIRDVFVIFTAVAVLWGAWEAHSSNNRVEKLSASNNDLLQASRARGLEVRRRRRSSRSGEFRRWWQAWPRAFRRERWQCCRLRFRTWTRGKIRFARFRKPIRQRFQ